MEEIIIRHYQKEDRQFVRELAWDTAFMGESAEVFFTGKEVFSGFLTEYFTDYEPESCFVAVNSNNKVIGYLLGAKDSKAVESTFTKKILAPLLKKAFFGGLLLKKKNWLFLFNSLRSLLCRESKIPDFSAEYPATLHINIDKEYRKLKIGSRLMAAYLDYLTKEKVKSVHLATLSDNAAEFFKARGFSLLAQGYRSYFRHILHKNVPLYIYGKKLNEDN